MKSLPRLVLALAAFLAAAMTLAAIAPMSMADTGQSVVTSSRSFPKTTTVRRNLLAESTSVSVDGTWTGVESLNVPKTKSTKEIETERKAAQEKAAREQAAKEAAEEAAQQEQQEAASSRSEDRQSLTSSNSSSSSTTSSSRSSSTATTSSDGTNSSALAQYAVQFVGYPYVYGGETPSGWDCSGFVKYVYAHYGITLVHSAAAQAKAGTAVANLASARPGDILANGTHAAIYLGNGLVVNAFNPTDGTIITSVRIAFSAPYSIRRLL